MSDPVIELVAQRLQAIAEPTRIVLMRQLEQGEATVQNLTDQLDTTHQNVSKHLGVLWRAGIVARRKDGNRVWYSLADFTACQLVDHVRAGLVGYVEELSCVLADD